MNAQLPHVEIDIQIEVTTSIPDETLAGALRQAVLATAMEVMAAGTGESVAGEMAIVLIDDERMRELNLTYRNIDATTDVLSFAAMDDSAAGSLVVPDGVPAYLGDVVISWPRAQRQAAERGHAVEAELCLLAIHGMLHLLGHDHAEPQNRADMWVIQRTVLDRLGYGEIEPTDE